ncbi:MAG: PadR family transcriptional regulator [Gemmatimonadota bacterium]|nr:PadR family transcriptional regulator [Gemmatimonadota bacterium]
MTDRFFDNWTTQLRKGVLELAVLNALADEPLYGYDLVRALGRVEGLGISEGTIYPLLSRLKREGLVETYLVDSSEGPARKYYRLTESGRTMLEAMNEHWTAVRGAVESMRKEIENR